MTTNQEENTMPIPEDGDITALSTEGLELSFMHIQEARPAFPAPRVHPSARVDSPTAKVMRNATVGPLCVVAEQATVTDEAEVATQAVVKEHAVVSGQAHIGEHANIGGQSVITENAWVDGARVFGNAQVCGYARLAINNEDLVIHGGLFRGTADLGSTRHYFTFGPIGSEDRMVTVHRAYSPEHEQWGALVNAGCFLGTVNRLETRIDRDHAWGIDEERRDRYANDYRQLIRYAKMRLAEWREESAPTQATKDWWKARLDALHAHTNVAGEVSRWMNADGKTEW